mgnify:CR=1 FL=1
MKIELKWLFFILALLLPILACNDAPWPVDPTRLAPNNLAGEDFSNNVIRNMDLVGKDFSNANFAYGAILFTKFNSANLANADFEGAEIDGNTFDFTNLQGANFLNTSTPNDYDGKAPSTFLGADLRGANLENSCFWADWTGAILDQEQAMIFDMMVHGVQNWRDWDLETLAHICFSTEYLKYNDIVYSSTREDFVGIDFSGAILSYSILSGLDLSFSDFSYAQLEESDLWVSNFEESDFSHANLFKADLRYANFTNAVFSHANLEYAWLAGANFKGADLTGASLKGVDISYTDFLGAKMDNQQLHQLLQDIKESYVFCIRLPDGFVILGMAEDCTFDD